jgi:hypothetical protein
MTVAATVFALTVLADAAGGAAAAAPPTVSLRGDLGLASAVGFAGVTVTFAPTSRFLIAAGATMGLAHGCARSLDTCVELYGAIFPQLRIGCGYWF